MHDPGLAQRGLTLRVRMHQVTTNIAWIWISWRGAYRDLIRADTERLEIWMKLFNPKFQCDVHLREERLSAVHC